MDVRLRWLWEQIGRIADRRGDAALIEGSVSLRVPATPDERAAARGLIGGRILKAGQSRRIDLSQLTRKLRVRGPSLTPGVVAAHALGRRLAQRAEADARRRQDEHQLLAVFGDELRSLQHHSFGDPDRIWNSLRRSGWIARLMTMDQPQRFLRSAVAVLAVMPAEGMRMDRRRLAADATGDPHALDHASALGRFVLAALAGAGRVEPRQRPRDAWTSIGVDADDVIGGLTVVGIAPIGWRLAREAVVTLPPKTLKRIEWPAPEPAGSWVFVTENPSVASAAADAAACDAPVRLLCTSGTPSAEEIDAIAGLAERGWRLAVRADFDAAGLAHVTAILARTPSAVPWRMKAGDYMASLQNVVAEEAALLEEVPETPWDPELAATMRDWRVPAYEEFLLPLLLDDLRRGAPPAWC